MNTERLKYIEVVPEQTPKAVVIWLHGLGADGTDFEPIVPALSLPDDLPLAFLFPHAPSRAVTINAGMVMPAWYDILEMDLARRVDGAGFRESTARVTDLVRDRVAEGYAPGQILLAGFSQGGAVALQAGLCFPERLAAVIGLSTYLAAAADLQASIRTTAEPPPIFMAHGTRDPLVPVSAGRRARDRLREMGCSVDWNEYPIQHEVCAEEVAAVRGFLLRVLGHRSVGASSGAE